MNKVTISRLEFCAMMLLFLMGSTIVVGLNFSVKEDSIVAAIVDMVIGVVLFYFYLLIMKRSSWKEFVPLLELGFGKILSKGVAILFCLYFLYIAARVTNDFAFFTTQIIYPDAPTNFAVLPFLVVIGYCVILGVEAVARSSIIILVFFSIITVTLWIAGFTSEEFQGRYLLPILGQGWKPIFEAVFPRGVTFPYGELVVFLVLIPLVTLKQKLMKVAWIPIVLSGTIIVVTMVLTMGILHATFADQHYFPFVQAMELVTYLDIIEHFEIFTYLLLIGGGFIKIYVFIFGALTILMQLFKLKLTKIHIIALMSVVYLLTFYKSESITEHLYIGLEIVPKYLHLPVQIGLPFILGIVVFLRTKRPPNTYKG
ncbi:GerAB/ArcD/ProY family transporter [Mangrovibacillus cuniculi]|uniref:Endospore germination permease n=1 Tax=Mangrovibacillus cuniculi TaxID=2593652 RepID=A0A7S8HGD5_9BACI|nr:endospore germination permease [Mangrovibacillus cuniculi]QPC47436.1 endospore germination permease [Mangrovibacillus cuniculi]